MFVDQRMFGRETEETRNNRKGREHRKRIRRGQHKTSTDHWCATRTDTHMHALGASKVWRHEAQGRLDLLGEFTYYKPGTALSAASTNLDDRVSDGNAKH